MPVFMSGSLNHSLSRFVQNMFIKEFNAQKTVSGAEGVSQNNHCV